MPGSPSKYTIPYPIRHSETTLTQKRRKNKQDIKKKINKSQKQKQKIKTFNIFTDAQAMRIYQVNQSTPTPSGVLLNSKLKSKIKSQDQIKSNQIKPKQSISRFYHRRHTRCEVRCPVGISPVLRSRKGLTAAPCYAMPR